MSREVLEPGSPGYEEARKPAIAEFCDIHPKAVVFCESADDVAATLADASRSGLPVVPRSGGHCFAGRSSTDGVVVDVSRMSSVSVSDTGVTVGAGVRLTSLYDELQRLGLTLPAGSGATVGIAGLTLGGGLGLLGRRYGLTCDRLLAARVVLADGRVVDCDQRHDEDLFWALRGAGGGHFGVVTSLVFDPVPEPIATRFHLVWPLDDAAAVIEAWQEWAPVAPDDVNANLRLTVGAVHLFGVTLATETGDLADLVDADPTSVSYSTLPYREALRSLTGLGNPPTYPLRQVSRSEFFTRSLPSPAIAALLRTLVPDGELNFTPMGGAYNRMTADATAFVHRDERFLLEHVAAEGSWPARSWATVHPWSSGRVYPNFPSRDIPDWPDAYYGSNYERLKHVKRTYDPRNLFRFHQSIPSQRG